MSTSKSSEKRQAASSAQDDNAYISGLLDECQYFYSSFPCPLWYTGDEIRPWNPHDIELDFGHLNEKVQKLEPLMEKRGLVEFRMMVSHELESLSGYLIILRWKLLELLGRPTAFRFMEGGRYYTHVKRSRSNPNNPNLIVFDEEGVKTRDTLGRLREIVKSYDKVTDRFRLPTLQDFQDGNNDDLVRSMYSGILKWVKTEYCEISSESRIVLAALMSKHIAQLKASRNALQEESSDLISVETSLDVRPQGFFVCLVHGCAERNVIYHDRSQWESHIRRSHHKPIWECTATDHGTLLPRFYSCNECAEHMLTAHPHALEKSYLPDLVHAYKLPRCCPVCRVFTHANTADGDWSQKMMDHMALHFRAINAHCMETAWCLSK
ncbi:hypothetical protein F5Y06DRAFT_297495 [Hypoxylon sp. FL0890]|nr:hypothetical protein F5Y06DRAFT_297495 [Hypoxylon sp. FL0890]